MLGKNEISRKIITPALTLTMIAGTVAPSAAMAIDNVNAVNSKTEKSKVIAVGKDVRPTSRDEALRELEKAKIIEAASYKKYLDYRTFIKPEYKKLKASENAYVEGKKKLSELDGEIVESLSKEKANALSEKVKYEAQNEETRKKLEISIFEYDKAKIELENAKINLNAAETEFEKVSKETDEKDILLYEEGKVNLEKAEEALLKADEELKKALDKKAVFETEKIVAEKELEDKNKELNKANEKLRKSEKEKLDAENYYNDLLKHKEEIENLENEENYNKKISEAEKAIEDYMPNLKKAEESRNTALNEKENIEKQIFLIEEKNKTINNKLNEVEKKYLDAVATKEKCENNLEQAKKNRQRLESQKAKVKELESDYLEKKDIANKLKVKAENAKAQLKKGALGFFESTDNTDSKNAVGILRGKDAGHWMREPSTDEDKEKLNKIYSTVNIGDSNDATGLENFRKAIEFTAACNRCREMENEAEPGLNLKPARVTDSLMAISMVSADANGVLGMGHVSFDYFNSMRENLHGASTEYGVFFSNYSWYTSERKTAKEVYEPLDEQDEQAGYDWLNNGGWNEVIHYYNLVAEDVVYIGVGVKSGYMTSYNSGTASDIHSGDRSYTPEEYLARFDAYVEELEKAPENYDKALKEVEYAKNELDKENKKLASINGLTVDEAEEKLEKAKNNIQTTKAEKQRLENLLDGNEKKLRKENIRKVEADKDYNKAVEIYNASIAKMNNLEKNKEDIIRVKTEKEQLIKEINERILEANNRLELSKKMLKKSEGNVIDANAAVLKKTEETEKLNEEIRELNVKIGEFERNRDRMKSDRDGNIKIVEERRMVIANYLDSEKDLGEAKEAYEDLKKELNNCYEAVEDNKKELYEAERKLEIANCYYNEVKDVTVHDLKTGSERIEKFDPLLISYREKLEECGELYSDYIEIEKSYAENITPELERFEKNYNRDKASRILAEEIYNSFVSEREAEIAEKHSTGPKTDDSVFGTAVAAGILGTASLVGIVTLRKKENR